MIRGYFERLAAGQLAPRVRAYVWVPALGSGPDDVTQISFLIDTGAMPTVLMPDDVGNLPGAESAEFLSRLRALPTHEALGVGGSVTFYGAAAYIVFHHEDGASSILELPIQLADPTKESALPSVLGFSALVQMVLHIDGPALSITLDAPVVRLP